MRRHVVDGAEILRRTPEMPILAPVVAFEHHLRLDGSGYPFTRQTRDSINLAIDAVRASPTSTTRCGRSAPTSRRYPSDRILAVLKRNDGAQFDQNLVRRFVQLLGIYPPGNLVQAEHRRGRRRPRASTRPIRTGRACGCSSAPTARGSSCPSSATCGSRSRDRERDGALENVVAPVDPADYRSIR